MRLSKDGEVRLRGAGESPDRMFESGICFLVWTGSVSGPIEKPYILNHFQRGSGWRAARLLNWTFPEVKWLRSNVASRSWSMSAG